MSISLYDHQRSALEKMKNGCILCGGVGSGKSRTALAYYYLQQGGNLDIHDAPMKNPLDIYIITTARKRDTCEWEDELAPFLLSTHEDCNYYKNKVVIDSWNNISKYKDVKNSFFIFDEQRVVGYGAWTKAFLKIAKVNKWILLSATPGDTWQDYIPVFIANGFYRNKTDFIDQHVVYDWRSKYPKVDRYLNTGRLIRLRNRILVTMEFERHTTSHHQDVPVSYNIPLYKDISRNRWNPWEDRPIETASELCMNWRRVVNSDESRSVAVLEIMEDHPKVIIFYNFDYELDILKNLGYPDGTEVAEWNGHKHQEIPTGDKWVYLVQYTAGCEGWNCITTDTIIFVLSLLDANHAVRTIFEISIQINDLAIGKNKLEIADGIEVAIFLIGQKLFDDDLELLVRREVRKRNGIHLVDKASTEAVSERNIRAFFVDELNTVDIRVSDRTVLGDIQIGRAHV